MPRRTPDNCSASGLPESFTNSDIPATKIRSSAPVRSLRLVAVSKSFARSVPDQKRPSNSSVWRTARDKTIILEKMVVQLRSEASTRSPRTHCTTTEAFMTRVMMERSADEFMMSYRAESSERV